LIRESYRENGKVKYRTVSNITKLPKNYISRLKQIFKGEQGEFNVADLENGSTYEYGASYAFKELAKQIGLDKAICSTKEQWKEDVMAMIIGRITCQGSKLHLINQYLNTGLWELAGHKYGERPDVEENCYKPMDQLLMRKTRIEKKLASKHLKNGTLILYDMTNTWFEGEYSNSEKIVYGKPKGGKRGYKQISLGLLTNHEGCPVGVEIFKGSMSDQKTVIGQIKKISKKYGITEAVFVGDRGMLTPKRIDELKETDFKIITALTHRELKSLIERENIQPDLFDQNNITEIIDSADIDMRYMLCKNDNEMAKSRETRKKMIAKVSQQLSEKAAVKRKRDPLKVAASVGRIFERCKIEKFFNWQVGENGEFTWELKECIIEQEEELDGCYVIKTNANKNTVDKESTVIGYRNLQKVEQAFKNMKTVLLELRPIYHKTDKRVEGHIFIVMLAYYLQWHAMQRLKPLFDADGVGKNRLWTFETVVERLKHICKIENIVGDIVIKTNVSKPQKDQQSILDLLNVKLV
jgi:transposase